MFLEFIVGTFFWFFTGFEAAHQLVRNNRWVARSVPLYLLVVVLWPVLVWACILLWAANRLLPEPKP